MLDAAEDQKRLIRLVVPSQDNSVEDLGRFARAYHVTVPQSPFGGNYCMLLPHGYFVPTGSIRRTPAEEQPDVVEICDKYPSPVLGGLLRAGLLYNRYESCLPGLCAILVMECLEPSPHQMSKPHKMKS